MDRLDPIERRCGVAQFADAIVERALAAPDAAEVEAQHRETARDEAFVHRLRDAVVHRPAALRVWVEDQRNRRARARRGRETAFDARSEEHTSELQSLMRISYAVFCLKKKTK